MRRSLAALATTAALALAPALARAGTVTVKGSDTMVILTQRWAEAFMRSHPATKVQVTGGGSGIGIAALVNGTTDIADASRAMTAAERQRVAGGAVETAVAKDGVAFYVNDQNPVRSLTVDQLRDLYLGDVSRWKDVGGKDAPVVLYSRENSSGTYVFVKEEVLKNQDYSPRAQTLPGTAAVVNAVAKEPNGIGYGGAAYAKGVRDLAVAPSAGGAATLPTKENVQSGKYPLARNLFMYTRGQPAGEVKQFIDFCLSPQGQAIVAQVGYFPLR